MYRSFHRSVSMDIEKSPTSRHDMINRRKRVNSTIDAGITILFYRPQDLVPPVPEYPKTSPIVHSCLCSSAVSYLLPTRYQLAQPPSPVNNIHPLALTALLSAADLSSLYTLFVKGVFGNYVKYRPVCFSDNGLALMCMPSAALQELVPNADAATVAENNECPSINVFYRPSMAFIIETHCLAGLKEAMKQAVRKAACRSYALQVRPDDQGTADSYCLFTRRTFCFPVAGSYLVTT